MNEETRKNLTRTRICEMSPCLLILACVSVRRHRGVCERAGAMCAYAFRDTRRGGWPC